MSRIARIVGIGFPHHVVQRGNNKGRVFFDREDRERYLSLLKIYSKKWKSSILAYCLMDNHIHLLLKPILDCSLSKMMQGIAMCYTQYFNVKYVRTGRLWEDRYYSRVVDNERYLWAVARYIEQNPRRAKLVEREEDYSYSSATPHIQGQLDDVLTEAFFPGRSKKEYAEFLHESISEEELETLRCLKRKGRGTVPVNKLLTGTVPN